MECKRLYVMAQYDEETEIRLNKIKKSLLDAGITGNLASDFPNHITLGSFELDKESELKNKIRKICKSTKKIPISFDNIGLFGMKVLFIAPSVTYELLNLQEPFNHSYPDNFNWVAHTTMILDEPDIIQKALPIVAENFSSFSGYIESVVLYEYSPSRFILKENLI
ncbi:MULTISPECIES: 2'-5' RNA ligase family protein [Clostridia]|uniref:2'-5' RNA ligase family protein n=1 Tax=Clostridium sp. CCUG 7971 TaxID=2811414 RepID=UPI001ABBDD98|nr:2'-5' RNA ligase family protein [Clostridium sp. CCUG 7971]MBO3444886.1 2'-5' RNA ligase family protein [Clostridium sp. CCUG 7971]